jgi:hypothetical protein
MKNLFKAALLVMFITVAQAAYSNDVVVKPNLINSTKTIDALEAQKLINRLEEIKAMDKSSMTRSEKKDLKKEVKAIQKRLDSSGGVYLSVGAVILIIVLLIILL